MIEFAEKFFKLKENNTDFKTEVLAGLTTFVTMAYILAVNPDILSNSGMDKGAVFTATILSTIIATLIMSFYANYPFVLSAGMGLNAFFTFSVVKNGGHSWQFALTAVFLEGVIFILLTFVKVREAIINSIPNNLKAAVSVGIGLFICFIGMQSCGLIVKNEETLVSLGSMTDPKVVLALIGLTITTFLLIKNVKGAILFGVLLTTLIGIPMNITKLEGPLISMPPSIKSTALAFTKVSINEIFSLDMLFILLTFLFVDLFDTVGMLVGTASKADMLDENGQLPNASKALFADAIGTTVGAMLGTSTITTFAESASGISEGGRTGLTSFTTSVLFALSLFFSGIFTSIPSSATAPALIIVGIYMVENIYKVDFTDYTEGVPAFLCIVLMPLSYSIGNGLMIGICSYVVCNLLAKNFKKVSPVMLVLAILFTIKFIFVK